jgi:uncharacterized protein
MHPIELQPYVFLKKSPFLVVKQLDDNEVRVYSKLHGNLTSFNFDINAALNVFDSPVDLERAIDKVAECCPCEPSDLIKELYGKRFLIEDNRSETDILAEYVGILRSKHEIPQVSQITFLISAQCNLACKGCYHNFFDFKDADMTGDFAGQLLEGLFPYLKKREIPAVLISFLGYEPLLNFETLRKIIDQAGKMGEEYGITTSFKLYTNAFSLSAEKYQWIEQHKSKLDIIVSLDGIKEDNDKNRVDFAGSGTYDRVIENLKRIINRDIECAVITVLCKANFSNIEKFVDEMAAIGVKSIIANIFYGQSTDERLLELTELEKFAAIRRMDLATEKYGIEFIGEWKFPVVQMITGAHLFCPAGRKQLVFSADGVIYPCQRFAGTTTNFGTYDNDFWDKLIDGQCESYNSWTAELYNGVTERTEEEKIDLAGCRCPFLPFLRGECISKNLERELNGYLLEYYLTRPLERILAKSPMDC